MSKLHVLRKKKIRDRKNDFWIKKSRKRNWIELEPDRTRTGPNRSRLGFCILKIRCLPFYQKKKPKKSGKRKKNIEKSAEASGLWACRGLARGSVPPILQSSNPGGGFTLPLPPPWRLGSDSCWRVGVTQSAADSLETLQDGSKTTQRRLQDAPRCSKTLQAFQNAPKMFQDNSETLQDTPKTPSRHPHDASKTRCSWIWEP